MNIAKRSGDIVTSFIKKYGPSSIKKLLWDQDFSELNGISLITRWETVSTHTWKSMRRTETSWISGVDRATRRMN